MSKKKRLGSDPLDFIQDTREESSKSDHEKEEKIVDEPIETETSSEKTIKESDEKEMISEKPKREIKKVDVKKEIIELYHLKVEIKPEDDDFTKVIMTGDIIINNVKKLSELLIGIYDNSSTVEVNFEGVTKIDTSGFQLFYMLKRQSRSEYKNLVIINPSECVASIVSLYGEYDLIA